MNEIIRKLLYESYTYPPIQKHADDEFNRPIRRLSRLLKGITSNNHGDLYCLGCLHSFRTDNALKNMKDCVVTMIIAM